MTEVREEGIEALPGTVQSQYIRCGKAAFCCRDGKRHGPYHYRVWRDGKKVRKAYVPTADVERVQAQCDLYRHYRERLAHEDAPGGGHGQGASGAAPVGAAVREHGCCPRRGKRSTGRTGW